MTTKQNYLLQLTLGPVQDFIVAARRTRDLWFGSFMLSELSKAAALSLATQPGVTLIFPSLLDENGSDIPPEVKLASGTPNKPGLNVANVILAEVHDADSDTLKQYSAEAQNAAQRRFEEFANKAKKSYRGELNDTVWDAQIGDVIEFYAGWVPLTDSDYKTARAQLSRLLASRKNLRDFTPNPVPPEQSRIPKSSLDGLRETVLLKNEHPSGLQIKRGESLDAVGLTKRLSETQYFPSVMRVAVDPWVRGKGAKAVSTIKDLPFAGQNLCDWLVGQAGVLTRTGMTQYRDFPYDGALLYEDRHPAMREDCNDDININDVDKALETVAKELKPEPREPYLGIICADGDHMGATIAKLDSPDKNRYFSSCLAGFADKARDVVVRHHGAPIYTGGDDVLAFVPLDEALECARDLHEKFNECMSPVQRRYNLVDEDGKPIIMTLSLGLTVASAQEELDYLLDCARKAEKLAKNTCKDADPKDKRLGDRDGLAVTLRTRGSSVVELRERWQEKTILPDAWNDFELTTSTPLDARLLWWGKCFADGKIPTRFPYELRHASEFYKEWDDDATCADAAAAETRRIMERKEMTKDLRDKLASYISDRIVDADSMKKFAEEIIVAKHFAEAKDEAQKEERHS